MRILQSAARAAAITISAAAVMLGLTVSTYAANGDNGLYFYDFENYDAQYGQGIGPDKYIGVANIKDNGNPVFQYRNFGPGNTDDEHGGVLKLTPAAFPSFMFPEVVNSGKVRISFDMKINDPENKAKPAIFVYGGTAEQITRSKEFHLMAFNGTIGGVANGTVNYAKYLAAWNATNSLSDFTYDDAKEWTHYDFLISDLGAAGTPLLDGYINGKLAFSGTQLNSIDRRNLRTFGIWMEGGAGAEIYVDNFYVKKYAGETNFKAETYGQSRFSVENGTIKVAMTERSKEPVTRENITIKNSLTGEEVTEFDVENFTGRTFDIKINETVDFGKYIITFDGVVGQISGTPLSAALSAETEYKTAIVKQTVSDDFNGYTDTDGTLPTGFECLEGVNTYAVSAVGSTGEDGDKALGFTGMPSVRQIIRSMKRFDSPIDCKEGLDVSFDAYVDGADMYFYLADENDFSTDNEDYKNNAVLLIKKSGYVLYADGRTDSPSEDVELPESLTTGEWHSVRIRIEPDEGDSYLVISIDGGDEYRYKTERPFCKGSVYGMGVGYLKSGSAQADIRIDNVSVSGSITAFYPQIETVAAYDSFGSVVDLATNPTAMINEIRADFNTYISHDLDACITVTEDGAEMPISYEVIDNADTYTSTLVIRFDDLLNRLREYSIIIGEGVPSAYSDEVTSFMGYETVFTANNEAGFKCDDFGYDEETKTANIVFSKNNSETGSYIYAVAGYKTVTVTNNEGEAVEAEKLVGMDYVPINISSDEFGRFEYKVKYNGEEAQTYKTYLWKYPKLEKLERAKDGTIE